MKRVLLIINIVVIGFLGFVIYQQHQLIKEYRATGYITFSQLNQPVERILTYHENKDYIEDTNQKVLNTLVDNFRDIHNNSNWSLALEPQIEEKYYSTFNTARAFYSSAIQSYLDAKTEDERQQAYNSLNSQYKIYSDFAERAYKELGVE